MSLNRALYEPLLSQAERSAIKDYEDADKARQAEKRQAAQAGVEMDQKQIDSEKQQALLRNAKIRSEFLTALQMILYYKQEILREFGKENTNSMFFKQSPDLDDINLLLYQMGQSQKHLSRYLVSATELLSCTREERENIKSFEKNIGISPFAAPKSGDALIRSSTEFLDLCTSLKDEATKLLQFLADPSETNKLALRRTR